jgi:serine/threonine-protein phosphatase 2A activator
MANVSEERLALEILPKYLEVVWTLQDRYSLEPAGSHGVWGLDDYQFVPYAIGAAQLRTQPSYAPLAVTSSSHKPLPSPMSPLNLLQFVPSTSSLSTQASLRTNVAASTMAGPPFANLYTTSIARIHSLKRGPFNEHSPILYDIATTVPNWVKVHGGMMKMWQAECLGKRPVVQHFPFGVTGFVWDDAESDSTMRSQIVQEKAKTNLTMAPTAAPWAPSTRLPPFGRQAPTQAPWHRKPETG